MTPLTDMLRRLALGFPKTAIFLLMMAVYFPFMGDPVLRTTGDEKTYVAQALEMERDGRWFVQTLADESDYYKGPLHLILLRVGFALFGHTMWATLYANFLLILAAAWLLQRMFRLHFDERQGWDLLYAGGFVLSMGLYAHMFASQMETELIAFYAFALYLLWWVERAPERLPRHLLLWGVIGLAGWLKSPLHSALLGFSVVLFWLLIGTLRPRLASPKLWLTVGFGVAVCLLGYLPLFWLDGDSFVQAYIVRESLSKGPNGVPWYTSFVPVMTYYLAPLMFPALLAFFLALKSLRENVKAAGPASVMLRLSVALAVPTLLFFTFHPYRGEIYALPAVSATWLLAVVLWRRFHAAHASAFRTAIILNALVLSVVPAMLLLAQWHLAPLPAWWPAALPWLSLFTLLFMPGFGGYAGSRIRAEGPALLVAAFVPLYLVTGTLLSALGKQEMADLDRVVAAEPQIRLGYENLRHNVWSEWGYLNAWLSHPVTGIHTEAALLAWMDAGETLLVPGDRRLAAVETLLRERRPGLRLEIRPWRRWLTHGKTAPDGGPRFAAYWHSGDLAVIRQYFYIVTPRPPKE